MRFMRYVLLIGLCMTGPARAQTAAEEFRETIEVHMIMFCTKINDSGEKAACTLEHKLAIVKGLEAAEVAANSDLFRRLGNHDKADMLRAHALALMVEVGADLDRIKATYRK